MNSIYKTDVDQGDLADLRSAVMALKALTAALYNAHAQEQQLDLMGLSYLMEPHVESIDAIEKKLTEANDAAESEAWKQSGAKVVKMRKKARTA